MRLNTSASRLPPFVLMVQRYEIISKYANISVLFFKFFLKYFLTQNNPPLLPNNAGLFDDKAGLFFPEI